VIVVRHSALNGAAYAKAAFDKPSPSAQAVTAELARMTQRLAPLAGDHETALPDLRLHRRNGPTERLHCNFPLGFALTTQGHSRCC
jgi:hypothetical protein